MGGEREGRSPPVILKSYFSGPVAKLSLNRGSDIKKLKGKNGLKRSKLTFAI
jgi:hypothetical protein